MIARRGSFESVEVAKRVYGLVLVLAALVVAALLIWRFGGRPGGVLVESVSEAAGQRTGALPRERASAPPSPPPTAASAHSFQEPAAKAELSSGEVIDAGRACGMARGEGPAWDLAAVTLGGARRSAPARFSVLDASGALMSGELSSYPYQMKLGRTPGGEVVAGFGGMAWPTNQGGLLMQAEPLRIYVGDQIADEKRAVLMFGVASDGSSYFAIEPLGSLFSPPAIDYSALLAISNRSYGTEALHDLGAVLVDSDGFLAYRASYTADNQEVHLEPLPARHWDQGVGTHYFYDVRGEAPPREIQVPDRGRYDVAHFTSSEEGYIFYEAAHWNAPLDIVKARFTWSSEGGRPRLLSSEAVWRQAGPVNANANHVAVSPNGAWLLFKTAATNNGGSRPDDWGIYVLDSATGETVFHLPTDDTNAQIVRLSSVLPAQPTEEDVGYSMGAFFAGDDKLVVRRLKDKNQLIDWAAPIYDVYDLNSITLDAQPDYRFEGNERRENQCASRGFPGTLVESEEGRLAYSPLR